MPTHPHLTLTLASITLLLITNCTPANNTPTASTPSTPEEPVANRVAPNLANGDTLRFKYGVKAIHEDARGNTWFGSHTEGLALLKDGALTYFTEADGLSDRQVRNIYEHANGLVFFECGRGISVYDGESLSVVKNKRYDRKRDWALDPGDLWFKADPGGDHNELEGQLGVYRYDGKDLFYHVFNLTDEPGEPNYTVSSSFAGGGNGHVWFGTYEAVIGYDGRALSFIDNASLGLNQSTGFLHVRSLFQDSQGNLWLGNNGIGVLKYDGEEVINFSKQHQLTTVGGSGMGGFRSPVTTLEHVFAINEDHEGNIWFGDRDTGAWRYDGKSVKHFTAFEGMPQAHVMDVHVTGEGEVWIAMADGSVRWFNGMGFERIL